MRGFESFCRLLRYGQLTRRRNELTTGGPRTYDDRNIGAMKLLFSISDRLCHYLILLLLSSERLSSSATIPVQRIHILLSDDVRCLGLSRQTICSALKPNRRCRRSTMINLMIQEDQEPKPTQDGVDDRQGSMCGLTQPPTFSSVGDTQFTGLSRAQDYSNYSPPTIHYLVPKQLYHIHPGQIQPLLGVYTRKCLTSFGITSPSRLTQQNQWRRSRCYIFVDVLNLNSTIVYGSTPCSQL